MTESDELGSELVRLSSADSPESALEDVHGGSVPTPAPTTDRSAVVTIRLEQAALRRALQLNVASVRCGICGRRTPRDLAVAGHIKPRSHCTQTERMDIPWVGMAVCLLGCDALYERGYISVDETGGLLIAPAGKDCATLLELEIGDCVPSWHPRRGKYFRWHREHVFGTNQSIRGHS